MNSFYSEQELNEIEFKGLGKNVLISRKCSIYSPDNIIIGDNVRIDDFCILSGKIELGSYIHIAAYCGLYGGDKGIKMKDFSGLSSRCVVYAASDDYSGEALTNPMIDDEYRNIISSKVIIGKHVVIGSNSTILPGVEIGDGSSVGSCSLVTKSCNEWGIYVGIPVKKIKDRSKKILELEQRMKNEKQ